MVIVSYPLKYHSMIANQFESTLVSGEKLHVMGGGLIKINKGTKFAETYGSSGGFGPPNRDLVEEVLKNTLMKEGYKLKVTVTDYIRD